MNKLFVLAAIFLVLVSSSSSSSSSKGDAAELAKSETCTDHNLMSSPCTPPMCVKFCNQVYGKGSKASCGGTAYCVCTYPCASAKGGFRDQHR